MKMTKLPFEPYINEKLLFQAGMHPFFQVFVLIICSLFIPFSLLYFGSILITIEDPVTPIIFITINILNLVLIFSPWILSGNCYLTTRRVYYRSRFGKIKQLPVSSIERDKLKVSALTNSIKIPGYFSINFTARLQDLWGYLILLNDSKIQSILENSLSFYSQSFNEVSLNNTDLVKGLSVNRGLAITRPSYIAFVPVNPKYGGLNFLSDFILVFGGFGFRRVEYNLPFYGIIENILKAGISEKDFDEFIHYLANKYGGFVIEEKHIDFTNKPINFQVKSEEGIFVASRQKIKYS
jgi:hypothetical protein